MLLCKDESYGGKLVARTVPSPEYGFSPLQGAAFKVQGLTKPGHQRP
jgi:hypothetical protein